ncbi:ATP-binding protein [Streptomyces sp. NBC_00828]
MAGEAILDRLLHHCDVVSINGNSYRLKAGHRPPSGTPTWPEAVSVAQFAGPAEIATRSAEHGRRSRSALPRLRGTAQQSPRSRWGGRWPSPSSFTRARSTSPSPGASPRCSVRWDPPRPKRRRDTLGSARTAGGSGAQLPVP